MYYTKGKVNKYGKAKLFEDPWHALKWLSYHKLKNSNGVAYEIMEASLEQVERWR